MPGTIRPYKPGDRDAVRKIFGPDEFARPKLMAKYPRMADYNADDMSYYTDYEPESLFVAKKDGQVVSALLGAVDTYRVEHVYRTRIRPMLWRRLLVGAYGWPGWMPALWRTELAEHDDGSPKVDPRKSYPAHLHIGVLPEYRRLGLGTRLMERYADYLRGRGIPGYHLYASSYHYQGVAFYQKIGLEVLAKFYWRLYTGFEWVDVTETVFGKRL